MKARQPLRRTALWLAVPAIAGYAWLATTTYRHGESPGADGPCGWPCAALGATAEDYRRAAVRELEAGLEDLDSGDLASAERLRRYRLRLEAAERRLLRSLQVTSSHADALARLAVVRWELRPPLDPASRRRGLDMIHRASAMAAGNPSAQFGFGELFLRLGAVDEGLAALGRALELAPSNQRRVTNLLSGQLIDPDRIADALPATSQTLASLHTLYRDAGARERYLERVEDFLASPPAEISPELLAAYGHTCLQVDEPARMLSTLDTLRAEAAGENAEWWRQKSRAETRLGRAEAGVEAAARAVELAPADPVMAELLGDAHLAAGDADAAIDSFDAGLRALSVATGRNRQRARLYRKIGEAEEKRFAPARAYDAYRRALEVDPNEPVAGKRMRQMQSVAP